ncbi:hypothetical protein NPIL_294941 [Nephila pilipes]|uniref:Uncharacterized protein n=1 Tax=Nephila pilipes TaxID=299642 RepID=A0A8X6MNI5_NEPPI|nr:hypothetical protein NPIL_294941 [Nephila pilipes]
MDGGVKPTNDEFRPTICTLQTKSELISKNYIPPSTSTPIEKCMCTVLPSFPWWEERASYIATLSCMQLFPINLDTRLLEATLQEKI